MRKPAVTMTEIARLAGVSQSTVSRVLNGGTIVAPEKQAAVLAVMEQLNYRPNLSAQGLVSGKTSTIGLLTRYLGSPFYGEMLRGTASGMQGSNYSPVIGLGGDLPNDDVNAVELLKSRQIDGLILAVRYQISDEYLREVAQDYPLIVVGRLVPGLENQCVIVKNFDGAYTATSYLIENGHTAIAHILGPVGCSDTYERRDGYMQALTDHGLTVDPGLIVPGDFTEESGLHAVDQLLDHRKKHPFTAIFVANDQTAMGVRLGLYHRQIAVPDDVSLVGFDDLPDSQYMTPPLTTVRQPAFDMGVVAAQAMLAMLAGESFALPEFPLELVIRQSVALHSENS